MDVSLALPTYVQSIYVNTFYMMAWQLEDFMQDSGGEDWLQPHVESIHETRSHLLILSQRSMEIAILD